MSSPGLDQPFPVINVAPQMGPILIGLVLGSIFFGITTLQTLFYYSTYSDDRFFLKGLVASLWIMDGASLALITHTVYYFLVLNYANPIALLDVPWSIASEPILSAIIALVVHLFLAYRVYALRNSLAPLAIFYVILSFVPIATGLTCVGKTLAASRENWSVVQRSLFGLATASNVSAAVLDLALAGTLCYLFSQNNVGFARTGKVLRMLSMYALATGLFTTLIVIAGTISQTVPTNGVLVFPIFNILVSKGYANSLMVTLNARQNIREKLETPQFSAGGLSIPQGNTPKPRSGSVTLQTRSDIVFNHSLGTATSDSSSVPTEQICTIIECKEDLEDLKPEEHGQYRVVV